MDNIQAAELVTTIQKMQVEKQELQQQLTHSKIIK